MKERERGAEREEKRGQGKGKERNWIDLLVSDFKRSTFNILPQRLMFNVLIKIKLDDEYLTDINK